MGGVGLIFTPMLVTRLLGHPGLSGPMNGTSWTHGTSKLSRWQLQPFILRHLYADTKTVFVCVFVCVCVCVYICVCVTVSVKIILISPKTEIQFIA